MSSAGARSRRRLMILADEERIRGYVHPVRMAILDLLAGEQRTITSVARELQVHPANITHHFRLLQRLGLVRLVEKRDTGRNVEKYYAPAARGFVVRPKGRGSVARQALALAILRDNLSAVIDRQPSGRDRQTVALLASVRLGERDVARFARRLQALLEEFRAAQRADGTSFSLNLSLYPDEADLPVAGKGRSRVVIE